MENIFDYVNDQAYKAWFTSTLQETWVDAKITFMWLLIKDFFRKFQ